MILNIVFFLINILILAVIYIILRRRLDKLSDPQRMTDSLTGDLDIILSEINQATERNILVIEDKVSELEEIIEIAEKRITLLRKAAAAEIMPKMKPPAEPAAVSPSPEPESGRQLAFEIPTAELTYSHLNKLNTMSDMVTSMSVPEKNNAESGDMKEKIISLHRNGIDSAIIASNVGINRGEVELIIALYTQVNGGQD